LIEPFIAFPFLTDANHPFTHRGIAHFYNRHKPLGSTFGPFVISASISLMFQVLLVTRGGARGKLFLWTAALQNLVFSRGFHSSSNFERCSQERFAFQKGLEGVAFAVTKLMADTRNPESFATSEPSKEIEDEDEYPRKARLFWVRHEHFFWRKTVKIADFTTASLPRKCYECPWGGRLWLRLRRAVFLCKVRRKLSTSPPERTQRWQSRRQSAGGGLI
jgi:hypothetical protein